LSDKLYLAIPPAPPPFPNYLVCLFLSINAQRLFQRAIYWNH